MTTTPSAATAPTDMTAMRAAIEAGRTTPAALVEQAIERAEAVNPELNFIAWRTFDRARAQASEPGASSRTLSHKRPMIHVRRRRAWPE